MKIDEKSKTTASRLARDIHVRMRHGLTPPELELLLADALSHVTHEAVAETWEAAALIVRLERGEASGIAQQFDEFSVRAKETSK